jgi:WD40 repeat protein
MRKKLFFLIICLVSAAGVSYPRVATFEGHGDVDILHSWPWDGLVINFSHDHKILATTSYVDGSFTLWDVAARKELSTLRGHSEQVNSVAFSPDDTTLASGSKDKTIKIWDLSTCKERATLRGHTEYVQSVAFSPDGKSLVSGSGDKTIKVWDVTTGEQQGQFPGYESCRVAFSPDGNTLAAGGSCGEIKLWDLTTGKEQATLVAREEMRIFNLAFSPDSKILASVDYGNSRVRLWDVPTGKQRACEHPEWLSITDGECLADYLAFSPDGKTLVAGDDETLGLWDVASGENTASFGGCRPRPLFPLIDSLLYSLRVSSEPTVSSAFFTPDGNLVAFGIHENTLYTWSINLFWNRRIWGNLAM